MAGSGDMIDIRVRLSGARAAAGEAKLVSAEIQGIGTASKRASAESAASAASFGKRWESAAGKMSRTGHAMTSAFTVPIVALGAASVKMALNFQQNMEMIHTQAGAAQSEVGKMSKFILGLTSTGKVAQGPNELSKALFRIESSGLRGTKAMSALKAASDLAMVGNADVADTAKVLGQAWFVNIKGAGDFNKTVGELNATVGTGDMRLTNLVDALGVGILPRAKAAGLGMQDVTAALAVFGDETKNVSGWAAQFGTALHFLYNPGQKAAAAMKGMHLPADQLAKDFTKPQGLLVALKDLKSHLDALPGGMKGVAARQTLADILPGGRGAVMVALLNKLSGAKGTTLSDKYAAQAAGVGAFPGDVARSRQLDINKIKGSWSAIQSALISVGGKLLPAIVPFVQKLARALSDVAKWFTNLHPGMQHFLTTAGGILALSGPLLIFLGSLARAIKSIVGAAGVVKRALVKLLLWMTGTGEAEAAAAGRGWGTKFGSAGAGAAGKTGKWAAAGNLAGKAFGIAAAALIIEQISQQINQWVGSYRLPVPTVNIPGTNTPLIQPGVTQPGASPASGNPANLPGVHGGGHQGPVTPDNPHIHGHVPAGNATPRSGRKVMVVPAMIAAPGSQGAPVEQTTIVPVVIDRKTITTVVAKGSRDQANRR